MRPSRGYWLVVSGFGLAFLFLSASLWFLFFRRLRVGIGSPLFFFMVISMATVVIIFLRYFTFLWLSYLECVTPDATDRPGRVHTASLIVPMYNEGIMVESCLLSLAEQDHPAFEIVVVDDGSRDDTLLRASQVARAGDVRVPVQVLTKPNGGKATALNLGVHHATGEVVVSVDGDSMLSPDALWRGCRHFADPGVGAVAGNVKVLNRDSLLGRLQALEYMEGLNLTRRALSYLGLVNIIPGPIALFRRDVVQEVGGYETDTFAEDADITLRVLRKGWRVVYEPRAIAYTEAPETWLQFTKQRYRWTRGVLQAIRKHAGLLVRPRGHWGLCLVMWYMMAEGILWPLTHIGLNLALLVGVLLNGFEPYLFFWWVQMVILDLVAAYHCVILEEEDWTLIPHAFYYRLFFVLFVDVARLLATFEEFSGLRMEWGKLLRIGPRPA